MWNHSPKIFVFYSSIKTLTSTGTGDVIPPRWANGVDGPTDIDDGLCCILKFLCTVNSTVAEAKIK